MIRLVDAGILLVSDLGDTRIMDSPVTFFGSLLFAAFMLVAILAWLWALIDCVQNESSTGNDRVVWLLIILLLGVLGAIVYIVSRRPARLREAELQRGRQQRAEYAELIDARRKSRGQMP